VIFCPGARSTNILATSKQQLQSLAQTVHIEERQSLSKPEINIINQLPHAANAPQHLLSNGSRAYASNAIVALTLVATFAISFL